MKKAIVLLSILAIWGINLLAAPINIPLGANAYLTQNAEGAKIIDSPSLTTLSSNNTVLHIVDEFKITAYLLRLS